MSFNSESSSCASRPIAAMVWMNEIESAKCIADLKTSYAITGAKLQTNFEVLDSKIAIDLQKIINGSFIRQKTTKKEKRFVTGRRVAYEHFNGSDNGRICLGTCSRSVFQTGWDETNIAMLKQSQSEQLQPQLSLYIHDTVGKSLGTAPD